MTPDLSTIKFEAYWRLLQSIAGAHSEVVVAGEHGNCLWASSGVSPTMIANVAAVVTSNDGLRVNDFMTASRGDTNIAASPIKAADDSIVCVVIAMSYAGKGKNTDLERTRVLRAVGTVRDLLAREVLLVAELDTVSQELGDRYEELNLLYSTEESLQYFEDPIAAIRQLVEKTSAHLGMDAVVLSLPNREMLIQHAESGSKLTPTEISVATERALEIVMETGACVVANDCNDTDGGILFEELGMKCLATPLFNSQGAVEGMLIALNNTLAPSFTNSDRNLLDVMTQRIRLVLESSQDSLTGLMARKAFVQHLKAALVMSRTTDVKSAILYLNIDRMHVINDMCGPHAGDTALCAVAECISDNLASANIAARLGGDEFCVLAHDCTLRGASVIADLLCKKIADLNFEWQGTRHDLSVSIGIAPLTGTSGTADEALSAAEISCNEAKQAGGGRSKILQQNDTVLVKRQNEMKWIGGVRAALRESRFELFAQAIESLKSGDESVHHEILVRIRGEDGKCITPNEFLPAAERYTLMPEIDRWVVDNAFASIADYYHDLDTDTQARERRHSSWAINLSGQSICDARMLKFITERLRSYRLPSEMICFEVTESAAVKNISDARRLIAALRAHGCRFSLDDFGTGVSSFAYLKNLPIDYLKIDGCFVRQILEDVTSDAVVAAISQVSKALGLRTIAEFVETAEIRARLVEMGIDYGQGYIFAKPVPLTEVLGSRINHLAVVNQ